MTAKWRMIGILACTQIISWGSMFYGFSVIAPEIERETGWSSALVFGAYSWSLLAAGVAATPVGMLLDRYGGRSIMSIGSVVSAIGLFALGMSKTPATYIVAWTIIGLAMSLTLYEAAFATINRRFALQGRKAISMLTLFAGFASTVFWPLTQVLDTSLGWRDTYLLYGAFHLVICLPLHMLLGKEQVRQISRQNAHRGHTLFEAIRHPAFWKLAIAFAANVLVFSALSVHLLPLLQELGHSAELAVMMAMLIGPMQVAGRVLERTVGRNCIPQAVGIFCFATLPAALTVIVLFGEQAWAVAAFCVIYGLSNGIITIVRGTLPQALFGSENYGSIAGAMAAPALLAKAAGPVVAALIMGRQSDPSIILSILLGVAVLSLVVYLLAIREPVELKLGIASLPTPGATSPVASKEHESGL